MVASTYLTFIGFATIMVAVGQNAGLNEIYWNELKQKLSDMTDKFKTICELRGKSSDFTVNKEELETCVHPGFKQVMIMQNNVQESTIIADGISNIQHGRTVEAYQVTAITNSIAVPICEFINTLVICIKPHLIRTLEVCSPGTIDLDKRFIRYIELILKSICKDNGRQSVEFLAAGGKYCTDSYMDRGGVCLRNARVFEEEKVSTTHELCNVLGVVHNCLSDSLDSCEKKRPSEILHSMLEDVKPWISTSCLIGGTPSSAVASLWNLIFLLLPLVRVFQC